jgi:hypothetical protein
VLSLWGNTTPVSARYEFEFQEMQKVSDPPAPPLSTAARGLGSGGDRGSVIPLTASGQRTLQKAKYHVILTAKA